MPAFLALLLVSCRLHFRNRMALAYGYLFPLIFLVAFWVLYRHETMVLEVVLPITYGGVWDYPYPEAQALIASMRDQLGAERLVWGSDMPNVERFCTYKQSLDYVRRYCPFLTAREKDLILGDTCAAFYGIGKGGR